MSLDNSWRGTHEVVLMGMFPFVNRNISYILHKKAVSPHVNFFLVLEKENHNENKKSDSQQSLLI